MNWGALNLPTDVTSVDDGFEEMDSITMGMAEFVSGLFGYSPYDEIDASGIFYFNASGG